MVGAADLKSVGIKTVRVRVPPSLQSFLNSKTIFIMANIDDFAKELKDLLIKYNASIGWRCSEGSDTHGIYGEELYIDVFDSSSRTYSELVVSDCLDKHVEFISNEEMKKRRS